MNLRFVSRVVYCDEISEACMQVARQDANILLSPQLMSGTIPPLRIHSDCAKVLYYWMPLAWG